MRRYRILLLIAAIASAAVAAWIRVHPRHRELRLFPGRPAYLFSYDDRANGGISQVRSLERIDAGLRFNFQLGPSRSAFAGAGADFSGPGRNQGGALDRRDDRQQSRRVLGDVNVEQILH